MKPLILICAQLALLCSHAAALDTTKIEDLTGLKGVLNEQEKAFKVTFPRGDLGITVDDWKMPAFMGLTTWAAFADGKSSEVMVMGDLVLLQDEVNPVMSTLLDGGLSVTALHNHFFSDEPKVYFMHIEGEGSVDQLAKAFRAGLDKVKALRAASPQPPKSFGGGIPEKSEITAAPLAAIFESKAQEKDGMVKFTIGRTAKMPCGCEIGKEMGLNTWAAFAGSHANAVVDGDFACQEGELQTVLKSLRGGGINIVAIHQHMTFEQPRYVFLHYWSRGKAADLAHTINAAIKTQAH